MDGDRVRFTPRGGQGLSGEKPTGGNPAGGPEVRLPPREVLRETDERFQGIASGRGYSQKYSRIKKVRYSHEAVIDVILANPTISQGELATRFEVTQAWLSRIIGSDAFQAVLAKRRAELVDPYIMATMEEKIRGVADQSLEIIAEKLQATQSADLALKALGLASTALGFGARERTPTNVQNNYVVALPAKSGSVEDWAAAAQNGAYEVLKSAKSAEVLPFSTTVSRDPTEQPKSMKILEDGE